MQTHSPARRKMIIDTDTASDDAVAILMALRWPNVDVLAITIVMGNVDVEQGGRNARYTVDLCGAKTPVHIGCAKPLTRKPVFAHWYHGPDGMGGMNYPESLTPLANDHAVDVLIGLITRNPGEIELVTLGPLTNIAAALARAPEIAPLVARCVIMGGAAVTIGNVTPAAEYNMWVDPEAAQIVLRSGMAIELVSWETGLGDPGLILNDPVTMAYALDPSIVDRQGRYRVDVESQGELTRGMTLIDLRKVVGTQAVFTDNWVVREPNAQVIFTVHPKAWKDVLMACLR